MRNERMVLLVAAAALVACGSAANNGNVENPAPGEAAVEGQDAEGGSPDVDVSDIKIVSGRDPVVNAANFKTFAWDGAEGALYDPSGKWALPDLNIANETGFLIDRELRERGMTEVVENPDVLVKCIVAVDMDALTVLKDTDANLTIVKNIPKGALVLAFIDPSTEETLWVGAAAADVKGSSDNEVVKARLDYVVSNVIKTLDE